MAEPEEVWAGRDMSNCSIARALDVIGERWTFLILREIWYGSSKFGELEAALHCPRNLLAERLRKLVSEGVLTTSDYRDPGARTRSRYIVTDKGMELVPVFIALMQWGDDYYADPAGPPVAVVHNNCAAEVRTELRCHVGHAVDRAELAVIPGPGYKEFQPESSAVAGTMQVVSQLKAY